VIKAEFSASLQMFTKHKFLKLHRYCTKEI